MSDLITRLRECASELKAVTDVWRGVIDAPRLFAEQERTTLLVTAAADEIARLQRDLATERASAAVFREFATLEGDTLTWRFPKDACTVTSQSADPARRWRHLLEQVVYSMDGYRRALANVEADLAAERALLREIANSGVEFDDERVSYVVVQIDRDTWNELTKLALAQEEDLK